MSEDEVLPEWWEKLAIPAETGSFEQRYREQVRRMRAAVVREIEERIQDGADHHATMAERLDLMGAGVAQWGEILGVAREALHARLDWQQGHFHTRLRTIERWIEGDPDADSESEARVGPSYPPCGDHYRGYLCGLPKGHPGLHREDEFSWSSAPVAAPDDDAPEPPQTPAERRTGEKLLGVLRGVPTACGDLHQGMVCDVPHGHDGPHSGLSFLSTGGAIRRGWTRVPSEATAPVASGEGDLVQRCRIAAREISVYTNISSVLREAADRLERLAENQADESMRQCEDAWLSVWAVIRDKLGATTREGETACDAAIRTVRSLDAERAALRRAERDPAGDGEREKLAAWLDRMGVDLADVGEAPAIAQDYQRAAALLRTPPEAITNSTPIGMESVAGVYSLRHLREAWLDGHEAGGGKYVPDGERENDWSGYALRAALPEGSVGTPKPHRVVVIDALLAAYRAGNADQALEVSRAADALLAVLAQSAPAPASVGTAQPIASAEHPMVERLSATLVRMCERANRPTADSWADEQKDVLVATELVDRLHPPAGIGGASVGTAPKTPWATFCDDEADTIEAALASTADGRLTLAHCRRLAGNLRGLAAVLRASVGTAWSEETKRDLLHMRKTLARDSGDWRDAVGYLAHVIDRMLARLERGEAPAGNVGCLFCRRLIPASDRGDERSSGVPLKSSACEIDDGRWVCSRDCWERAARMWDEAPAVGVEGAGPLTACSQAAFWFREYAQGHLAKGDREKAARNAERAIYLEAVVARNAPLSVGMEPVAWRWRRSDPNDGWRGPWVLMGSRPEVDPMYRNEVQPLGVIGPAEESYEGWVWRGVLNEYRDGLRGAMNAQRYRDPVMPENHVPVVVTVLAPPATEAEP